MAIIHFSARRPPQQRIACIVQQSQCYLVAAPDTRIKYWGKCYYIGGVPAHVPDEAVIALIKALPRKIRVQYQSYRDLLVRSAPYRSGLCHLSSSDRWKSPPSANS